MLNARCEGIVRWLEWTSAEGHERAVRVDEIVTLVEDPWWTPDGRRYPCTKVRTRQGQVYRIPAEYVRVYAMVFPTALKAEGS